MILYSPGRGFFNCVSKEIWDYLRSIIDPENSRHFLNQSDAILKPRFPALWVLLFFFWVLIGSFSYFPFFWLAVVIALVLVLWQSTEKRSMLQVQLTFTSATTLQSERELKWNVEILRGSLTFTFKTQKSDLTLAQVQVTGEEFGSTWTSTG